MTDSGGELRPKVCIFLELCKLFATIAMPVAVVVVGCVECAAYNCRTLGARPGPEQRQLAEADIKVRDKVREVRLAIYREAAPLINDIVSYQFYVGQWKNWRPEDVIDKKRQLDRLLYSHRPLLTPAFFALYHDFMRLTFRSARDFHGESPNPTLARCHPIRTDGQDDRASVYFTDEDMRQELCTAYAKLLGRVSDELLMQSPSASAAADAIGPSMCPPLYDVGRVLASVLAFISVLI